MQALARHALLRLSTEGWQDVLARGWDDEAGPCLSLWSKRDLPLVVTRQPAGLPAHRLATGLPAPAGFGRRRLALAVDIRCTRPHEGFPSLATASGLIEAKGRPAWQALSRELAGLGCEARVYGSHGWQVLTGLDHVHRDSDIDLLLPVRGAAHADAVCAALAACRGLARRLDGELVLPDGAGVAWREWSARPGTRGLLVKRLHGVRLEGAPC